jgi:hypothetical protein
MTEHRTATHPAEIIASEQVPEERGKLPYSLADTAEDRVRDAYLMLNRCDLVSPAGTTGSTCAGICARQGTRPA